MSDGTMEEVSRFAIRTGTLQNKSLSPSPPKNKMGRTKCFAQKKSYELHRQLQVSPISTSLQSPCTTSHLFVLGVHVPEAAFVQLIKS